MFSAVISVGLGNSSRRIGGLLLEIDSSLRRIRGLLLELDNNFPLPRVSIGLLEAEDQRSSSGVRQQLLTPKVFDWLVGGRGSEVFFRSSTTVRDSRLSIGLLEDALKSPHIKNQWHHQCLRF